MAPAHRRVVNRKIRGPRAPDERPVFNLEDPTALLTADAPQPDDHSPWPSTPRRSRRRRLLEKFQIHADSAASQLVVEFRHEASGDESALHLAVRAKPLL